jgi:hypothetical protein
LSAVGRRTKTPTDRSTRPKATRPGGAAPSPARRNAKPTPPRARRWFLAVALALLVAWMGFLAALALLAQK